VYGEVVMLCHAGELGGVYVVCHAALGSWVMLSGRVVRSERWNCSDGRRVLSRNGECANFLCGG